MPPEAAPPDPLSDVDLRPLTTTAAAVVLAGAGSLLLLWLFAHDALAATLARTMKANTSFALCLLAAALLLQARFDRLRAGQALALLAALIGAATMFEYAAGVDLRIDEALVRDFRNEESAAYPGRMAPNAALGLIFTGVALALMPLRAARVRQLAGALLLVTALINVAALLGYLYGSSTFYRVSWAIRISQYTALGLLLICAGALCAWPAGTWASVFARRTAGGILARRLLAPVIVIPILLGWLRNTTERAGLLDDATGGALMAVIAVALFGMLTISNARVLDRIDSRQLQTLRENEVLTREAQAAVRVRDEFIALAAHEFRTPLTSLRLHLQMLVRKGDPGAAKPMRQVDRLTRLVDGMLDTARITAGKLELKMAEVDLSELLRQSYEQLLPQFEANGTPLQVRSESGVQVRGDALRLSQALENLLVNAMKYGGGKPVEAELRRENGAVHLSVRDQGIGIEPVDRPRIFERFERAVPSTNFGGLGLGLYFARQVAEAHGGRIDVSSEPGKGSTFTLVLPAA